MSILTCSLSNLDSTSSVRDLSWASGDRLESSTLWRSFLNPKRTAEGRKTRLELLHIGLRRIVISYVATLSDLPLGPRKIERV